MSAKTLQMFTWVQMSKRFAHLPTERLIEAHIDRIKLLEFDLEISKTILEKKSEV